jgi:hypothetical protein
VHNHYYSLEHIQGFAKSKCGWHFHNIMCTSSSWPLLTCSLHFVHDDLSQLCGLDILYVHVIEQRFNANRRRRALFACDETIKSPQAITARFNFHTKRAPYASVSLSLTHNLRMRKRLREDVCVCDGFCVLYACYYEIDVINFDLERAGKRISNYRDTTIYM